MLVRIGAMLTKLLMRFDPEQYRLHESAAGQPNIAQISMPNNSQSDTPRCDWGNYFARFGGTSMVNPRKVFFRRQRG
jgi:hypothetical protein